MLVRVSDNEDFVPVDRYGITRNPAWYAQNQGIDLESLPVVDDSGIWVFDWGHAIGEEPIGEPTAEEKKNRLDHELIRLHRAETSESTEIRIDLRDGIRN